MPLARYLATLLVSVAFLVTKQALEIKVCSSKIGAIDLGTKHDFVSNAER